MGEGEGLDTARSHDMSLPTAEPRPLTCTAARAGIEEIEVEAFIAERTCMHHAETPTCASKLGQSNGAICASALPVLSCSQECLMMEVDLWLALTTALLTFQLLQRGLRPLLFLVVYSHLLSPAKVSSSVGEG